MTTPSVQQHRMEAPATVRCFIITVSDTRTLETDKSGQLIHELLENEGYNIVGRHIVKDDYADIQQLLCQAVDDPLVEAVLLNGGTGIAKRDTTYEAVRDLLEKELQGFGEIFRFLSYTEDIGSAAILSRAVAGIYKDKAIFSMPGSSGAVTLALTKILLPELRHIMREIYKDVT